MPKLLFLARVLCAAPLLFIGLQHLTGMAPMQPILEGAGMPMPELGATIAPVIEIVAGALLLLGLFPKIAGLLAVGSMIGALYAHLNFDWPDEPPIVLPIVVLGLAILVIARGSGAWALRSSKGDDAAAQSGGA